MRRRRTIARKPAKTQHGGRTKPKRNNASRATRQASSALADLQQQVSVLARELAEALQQQTATSEVLQVISRSPGELEPVFHSVLANAVRICEAKLGFLNRYDRETWTIAAVHGAVPAYTEYLQRQGYKQPGPETVVARVAATKQTVQIADLAASRGYVQCDPVVVAAVELGGVRTILGVPMLNEGQLVGAIILYRQEVRPFTDKQIELVTNFADQAVIAIENARLLSELRQRTADLTESLEQQTATSEVLKVISSSPGELRPVFQVMLSNAVRICEASYGILLRFERSAWSAAAMHGVPPDFAQFWQRGVQRPDPRTALGRLIETKQTVHIADITAEPAYLEGEPIFVAAVNLGRFRTILTVPVLKDNELIGVFAIYRQEARPFAEKQIALVQNFAAQAVIAIENARLLSELRQRTDDLTESLEQQTATSEVLRVISRSTGDPTPVFEAMLQNAVRICGAEFGNLLLCEGDTFRIGANHGAPAAYVDFLRREGPFQVDPRLGLGRMLETKQTYQVADIAAAPTHDDKLRVATIELAGARTVLGVPMLKDGEMVGCIVIYRQEVRPFTDRQIELVENFAAQAVIAIENTRLLNELRESLEQQTATSGILSVISKSLSDTQPVFDAIVQSGLQLFPGAAILVALRDENQVKAAAVAAPDPARAEALRRIFPIPLGREHMNGVAILDCRVVDIPDARNGPPELAVGTKNFLRSGYRATTIMPMLRGDVAIGALSVVRVVPGPISDKQRAILRTFADQAVIAIENARLLNELRARTDELARSVGELRALGEVGQAVNSTLDVETVLRTIVTKAVELSATDAGAIYVFDEDRREFRLRATYGMSEAMIAAISDRHIGVGDANIGAAAQRRAPIQIADLREAPASALNDIILANGYRALLVVPLLGADRVVGALVVRRREPGAFPQTAVGLLQTFADQSALAIQNARLFDNVETRTHELTKSLEDLRTAQDRLVQTEKLASLGQLTAGIAHEIKNPLNFVNNFSGVSVELIDEMQEALKQVAVDEKIRAEITELSDTLRDNLRKIVQHGKRADSIVKNMLLHSRAGSGERRLIDVNTLVEESLNLAYHGARAEKQGFNITLQRSFDPAAGEIEVFPQEIMRVLLNLIGNGFYAAAKRQAGSGEGFEATLAAATRSLGDRVEICIRDNGTGIPPEVKEKMFNPFYTTKPAGEGTGLGLSLSHDIIVKQHSGSIEVDTEPGTFTEFRIVLPRTAATPQ